MGPQPLRVVIAGGSGTVGRALAQALAPRCAVRALSGGAGAPPDTAPAQASAPSTDTPGVRPWVVDLASVGDTEVALAGAQVAVYLARASRAPAKLVQGGAAELELTLADSFARAARRVGARFVVTVAQPGDGLSALRVEALQSSGLPVVVVPAAAALEQTVALLAAAVEAKEVGTGAALAAPQALEPAPLGALAPAHDARALVFSAQLLPLPQGWTAPQAVDGYMAFAAQKVPLLSVARRADTFVLALAGVELLKLRLLPPSQVGVATLEVCGGALADLGDGVGAGRFEFRALPQAPWERGLLVVLSGFKPRLPWLLYRFTQAVAHAVVMRSFGRWLRAARPAPALQA